MGREARDFSTATAYTAGDLCLYGGLLYAFTASKSAGVWDGTKAAPVDSSFERDLTRVITGYDRAISATAYAGKVVFDDLLLTGTRYRYKFMDE